ncbi:MAG: cobaltochelatase subunit CobN [Pseudomonadota bacterium]|nr:cobaltochelatase subunit CobN [Pseudomonadota bacterium]
MLDNDVINAPESAYKFVIITLDSHSAGPVSRVQKKLKPYFPSLEISVHAAAEWSENPKALEKAKNDISNANIIVANLLFLEEHVKAILPSLKKRRNECDALVGCISSKEIVSLTMLDRLDMSKPTTGFLSLLKRLRGTNKSGKPASGKRQMSVLRRLPKILKFIPGKAQDVRSYFLTMLYWLGGSDDNVESMVIYLSEKYGGIKAIGDKSAKPPIEYPETGLYHPSLKTRITTNIKDIPKPRNATGTIGILLMRSYVLSGDTAHYDAVIKRLEENGLNVIPAFSASLDSRPAIEEFFHKNGNILVDCVVSLTGFSLVGGPAYNDSQAAEEILSKLNVPYVAAHALEFQTLSHWEENDSGLGPVETTMLVALPEIDGAIAPTVFGGRPGPGLEMLPAEERVESLVSKVRKYVNLRTKPVEDKRVSVILYGFPPNAGAIGTAAYLDVFRSLYNTLLRLKHEGYKVEIPQNVEELKDKILNGNRETYGQEANVFKRISADEIVAEEPYLKEIEAAWGPAPGKLQSDGSGLFILGEKFGNVFVGIQPAFGFEGDPMRLLFEKGFAPTHAFSSFYRFLRKEMETDAIIHFGMHGALEFMPGKKAGVSESCWPDRLIGDIPNIYIYAANNPSEGSLAKRRSNAVIISHLTPPLAKAGLYKGLLDLKESLNQLRGMSPDAENQSDLMQLIADQAESLDIVFEGDFDLLRLKLYELEEALIPEGLHVVGTPPSAEARENYLGVIPGTDNKQERAKYEQLLTKDTELPAVIDALEGKFIKPVPGGDIIRSPEILPTGRNMHAFDPFRMPTSFAMQEGKNQTTALLNAQEHLPETVAMVLWGSDNIKTDGGSIAQAMNLMGARPFFDDYGRLSGAELISLEELGRPRIDVLMTLSGIFRDLLPLQIKMLADASLKAAQAKESNDMNFIRRNTLAIMDKHGFTLEQAALRVFSNAEGTYGSNVNHLVSSASWDQEDELADTYENRKSYAYDPKGDCSKQTGLLQAILELVDCTYQNLESVELGVTTVDHYFDTLGGITRAVKRARGVDTPVFIGDQTRGGSKVRTLADQIALETRSRSLNPKWFEPLLKHGYEGVRHIESQVTNTFGWSATTGQVEPWVYGKLSETFILDEEMRRRLASLNPAASLRVANRLMEAHDRSYWEPDEETLEALRDSLAELEDNLEGVSLAAE